MTITDASNLTDERLRIRIAEWCGWSRIDKGTFGLRSGKDLLGSKSELGGTPPCDKEKPENDQSFAPIPNYPTSLDAMHEAVLKLGREHWTDYTMHLRQVIAEQCDKPEFYVHGELIADIWFYQATARQRAIALVATIGEKEL
jgi:hypothetical protein